MDIGLPGMDGVEGALPAERYPKTTLMLTAYEDDERSLRRFARGASGYLLKRPPVHCWKVYRGHRRRAPISEVARRVMKLFHEIVRLPRLLSFDAARLRILKLLEDGHNYATAAAELHVTANTINFHLQNITPNCKSTQD